MTYEVKSDILERQTKVKGLNLYVKGESWSSPTEKEPILNLGIDFNNAQTKFKWIFNVSNLNSETTATHKICSRWLLGANFTVDAAKKQFVAYNFGTVWEPADNALVGVKHESTNKDKVEIGKIFLYFFHKASAFNSVGSEFMIDW